MELPSGEILDGTFKEDSLDGLATISYPNGEQFTGIR